MNDDMEKALTILRSTNDGDFLAPVHLRLVEVMVNGFGDETARENFEKLYAACKDSSYTPPVLNGVEHMTIDHHGYVRYKGVEVEHFNSPWAYSAAGKKETEKLQKWCVAREAAGLPVDAKSAWHRYDTEQAPPASPKKKKQKRQEPQR